MQNQSVRSSFRNSYKVKQQLELVNYLVREMKMEHKLASHFIQIHNPSNIPQTLDLFLADQNGIINHMFMPSQGIEKVCRVCELQADGHREGEPQIISDIQDLQVQNSLVNSLSMELEAQKKLTCQICYIQVLESDMTSIKGTIHNICLQCMNHYIKEEINNMRVDRINCPHCSIPLLPEFIKDLVDMPTFNKYRLFLRNLQIQKSPNLKWCPNPKCAVVVSSNPKKKTSKCPKCATQICNKCNREAHPRSSCQGAFQKEIKGWENASDIQKCKKCQGLVEKIAGCNHMTCSICHFQWCWLCGSQYSAAHFSALNPFGCPGLQDRPRDDWGKCKIILLRVGLLLLILIGIPIALPIAMVAAGPVLIGNLIWNCIYPESCLKRFMIIIVSIPLGIISDPFVWVGCIFYFIPKGIKQLYRWYIHRRQNDERRTTFLQERLLAQEIFQQNIIDQ